MRQAIIKLGAAIYSDCSATRAADRLDKFHSFTCGQNFSAQWILAKPGSMKSV
jgi:hypothetical protein